MSRIPWTTYSGEDVERVLAIYICRENPAATHIRPSQGDNGIDLRIDHGDGSVTIFQIKKFAENLLPGQKRQIEDSWNTICDYVGSNGLALQEWHLVMPLDPTPQNYRWFKNLTQKLGKNAYWDGLSVVEGWSSSMPEVADYYLFDGKNALEETYQKLINILQLPDSTSDKALKRKLIDFEELLEERDPNYSYSIQVLSKFDTRPTDLRAISDNVVLSHEESLPGGQRLRLDVIPKYTAACEIEPISINVTLTARTDEEKTQLKRFVDLGTPLEQIPANLKSISVSLPFVSLDPNAEGRISSFQTGSKHEPIRFQLRAGGAILNLKQSVFSSGIEGFHWEGKDSSGLVCASIDLRFSEDSSLSITFKGVDSASPSCSDAKRAFAFLNKWNTNGSSELWLNDYPYTEIPPEKISPPVEYVERGLALANHLCVINDHSDREVLFPGMGTISNRDYKNIRLNAELLEHGYQEVDFDSITIEVAPGTSIDSQIIVNAIQPMNCVIGEETYCCGYVESLVPASSVEKKDEGHFAIIADEQYGKRYIRRLVDVDGRKELIGAIRGAKLGTPDEWANFKASVAAESQLLASEQIHP